VEEQTIRFTGELGHRVAWAQSGEGPRWGATGPCSATTAPAPASRPTAHPERVRALVVYGGYASGSRIADARSRRAIVDLVREHWGLGSRALTDIFMPSADAQEREAFIEFQRAAASAERAARSLEAVYGFDVAERLGQVPSGAFGVEEDVPAFAPVQGGAPDPDEARAALNRFPRDPMTRSPSYFGGAAYL
jgi:hypothetical protein